MWHLKNISSPVRQEVDGAALRPPLTLHLMHSLGRVRTDDQDVKKIEFFLGHCMRVCVRVLPQKQEVCFSLFLPILI